MASIGTWFYSFAVEWGWAGNRKNIIEAAKAYPSTAVSTFKHSYYLRKGILKAEDLQEIFQHQAQSKGGDKFKAQFKKAVLKDPSISRRLSENPETSKKFSAIDSFLKILSDIKSAFGFGGMYSANVGAKAKAQVAAESDNGSDVQLAVVNTKTDVVTAAPAVIVTVPPAALTGNAPPPPPPPPPASKPIAKKDGTNKSSTPSKTMPLPSVTTERGSLLAAIQQAGGKPQSSGFKLKKRAGTQPIAKPAATNAGVAFDPSQIVGHRLKRTPTAAKPTSNVPTTPSSQGGLFGGFDPKAARAGLRKVSQSPATKVGGPN